MRVGLDYRPVLAAPRSGIARQVRALDFHLSTLAMTTVTRFGCLPHGHPLRGQIEAPAADLVLNGQHRPQQRLSFEAAFLPSRLRETGMDVYIATANMGLPLGRVSGILQILLLHDLFQITEHNRHSSIWRAGAYRLIDWASISYSIYRASQIWTPSVFTAEEVIRRFPRARTQLRILPNLVDGTSDEAQPIEGLTPGYWLAIGTREPRKNIARLVTAWSEARRRTVVPDLVLLGAAEDLPPELRERPGLIYLDDLDEVRLKGLYQGADRLWQPSYAEGFGLPVVEALAVGTPVACARGSALDEVTPPWAPRFDAMDVPGLAALMITLAQPALREPIRGRSWATRFGAPAYHTRLAELLAELRS
ncbi:glycosyltransferase family 4 protein [Pseudomonas sp. CBMAI 2609]|uniref:Glycosyltransferase family 4 protein n=1 Tax=Pseudomonas flavocrustae TaxID=2991719 RepID=A0ABT6IJ54_9PSED|nr:glycosyltransferase family 1 protein [Pseudomonas sp. CBMAI 2609]MDH4764157.1 glycosyltransferase family 4 protein [Pseudomonas sp. CBMAI 2609]